MIPSRNIKPVKVNIPVAAAMGGPSILGRIKLKNIYQSWSGESFKDIVNKHENNPFNLRIGLPQMDRQMKEDRIFLFTKYLAYNPITKEIEKRELIPLRNVEKVYIGQSPEEHLYKDYRLFVDGTMVVEDIKFKQPNSDIPSLVEKLRDLEQKVQILQFQIQKLTTVTENKAIYK